MSWELYLKLLVPKPCLFNPLPSLLFTLLNEFSVNLTKKIIIMEEIRTARTWTLDLSVMLQPCSLSPPLIDCRVLLSGCFRDPGPRGCTTHHFFDPAGIRRMANLLDGGFRDLGLRVGGRASDLRGLRAEEGHGQRSFPDSQQHQRLQSERRLVRNPFLKSLNLLRFWRNLSSNGQSDCSVLV